MTKKTFTIMHLEASTGWGGQEMRTLKEACAMRDLGHTLLFAVQKGANLGKKAGENGFKVYEVDFRWRYLFFTLTTLVFYILKHCVDLVLTHSSKDGWQGGIAARIGGTAVIRTRHLSTPIRGGLNARLLYSFLADKVVTTCEKVAESLKSEAGLSQDRCRSIPTGACATAIQRGAEAYVFPKPSPFVIGTACILRSWKGLETLINALALLKNESDLSLVIVGDGFMRTRLEEQAKRLGVFDRILFTGHLDNPFPAIASFDLFLLLSTANEGVSQATLQAACLGIPLITTPIGGLPEVALDGKTGFVVPAHSPIQVAEAILKLKQNSDLRKQFGEAAKSHLHSNFEWSRTVKDLTAYYFASP